MPPNQRRFYAVSPSQKSPSSTSSGTASSFAQQLVEVHPERDGDYGGTEPTVRSPSGDGGDSGRSRPAHFGRRAGRVPVEMVDEGGRSVAAQVEERRVDAPSITDT